MELSKFNIISKIRDSEDLFILNSLYGSADILDRATCLRLKGGNGDDTEFAARGYLVNPEEEKSAFRKAYLRFLDDREKDEVQLFFVPSYSCNFSCSYCYQENYFPVKSRLTKDIAAAFLEYVSEVFADRRKYITLFGGEPLLPGKGHKSLIKQIIEGATGMKTDVAVVTNGYHIGEYAGMFREARMREVQVTLDGTREVHDRRRSLKNGQGTFDRIVNGIDLLLENEIPVNLRMVADRENIDNLPDLARFAIERGWTASPLFSTQIGRNYELHDCRANGDKLFSRVEIYAGLYRLIREHPHILEFHRPAFSVSGALYENGELPAPLFDACTGTKTEWAFDYTGNIYACTATVGKKGEELGRFYPDRVLNRDRIEEWGNRDILSIRECRECSLSLLCGGGCAAVAGNRSGSKNNPDCRPVRELLGMGIAAYFGDNA